jgi:hypothetical protein
VYVQLSKSNIYLDANCPTEGRRVGCRGIKTVPAARISAVEPVEVDGEVSSFVDDDQAYPRRFQILKVLRPPAY